MQPIRIARSRVRSIGAAVLACLAFGYPSKALSDDYPSRPIRIVVPHAWQNSRSGETLASHSGHCAFRFSLFRERDCASFT